MTAVRVIPINSFILVLMGKPLLPWSKGLGYFPE
jgi:hypothetical protein